ncbi:MAG: hypothetical protein NT150_02815 [Bacteroidetes bacterium]|nr:hypothetical protein [Bacteroidota bacterium]
MKRINIIFDALPETKEGDEAEILSIQIEKYENIYYPIDTSKTKQEKIITENDLGMGFPLGGEGCEGLFAGRREMD